MFLNRKQAGELLADKLAVVLRKSLDKNNSVVIGLPRGGVPVAMEVAARFGLPLDILVSKKIRAPDNPELAIGAVTSSGIAIIDDRIVRLLGNRKDYIETQKKQKEELTHQTKELEASWLCAAGITRRPELSGKVVIVVDDGIATGMTTLAALRSLRARDLQKLVLATPVIPDDTFCFLKGECDLLVPLIVAHVFTSVGCFYEDFHQVADEEMIACLRQSSSQATHPCSDATA